MRAQEFRTITARLESRLAAQGELDLPASPEIVPGDPFGAPEHIRVSYAVSLERIREGVRRISEAIATLG